MKQIWMDTWKLLAVGLLISLLTLLVCVMAGCSGQSSQIVQYTPVANACTKVSAWTWNSAGGAFICFDATEKPIGMVPATAQSPLDLASGVTNAAIISGGAAVAGALIAR